MKKLRFLALMLILLLLTGCTSEPLASLSVTSAPQEDDVPEPESNTADIEQHSVLWFRFLDEPLLAAEERTVSRLPNESYETALLKALLSGPSLSNANLTALFPSGTRIVSTVRQDDMLFVTLSSQIMNRLSDEPDNWQSDASWRTEIPLRRQLAMQSIAATITENTTVQQVVILVEPNGNMTDSIRLRQSYYTLDSSDSSLADPLVRDESLLLTPANTLNVILTLLKSQDYSRLYRYVAEEDPDTGKDKPSSDEFADELRASAALVSFSFSCGSIFGSQAAFTLSGLTTKNGMDQTISGRVVHLDRQNGLWQIPLSQLLALVEGTT
jgi:hypothetical protein